MKTVLVFLGSAVALLAQFSILGSTEVVFNPKHQLVGVGLGRKDMSDEILTERTARMIESQTFGIMRNKEALPGAATITKPALQEIFRKAAEASGFSKDTLEAIAYLESWGDPNAASPAGPKGIMQIAEKTATSMGLVVSYKTEKQMTVERVVVKDKHGRPRMKNNEPVYRIKKRAITHRVLVRDDRLIPGRAVPAAAHYLATLSTRYGSEQWAVFAYHCGEACAMQFLKAARETKEMKKDVATVPKVFFFNSPAYNQKLFELISHHMERDWSPTYWFRIERAKQLLSLYRSNPKEFAKLARDYRNKAEPDERAPNRLWVWLSPDNLYASCDDLRTASGKKLFKAFNNPGYFGFSLRTDGENRIAEKDPKNQAWYLQASQDALGNLVYIAFETRRLFDETKHKKEKWMPLDVTALVRTVEYQKRLRVTNPTARTSFPQHCTGKVFDISYFYLGPVETKCLRFVIDDLEYYGYLGFAFEKVTSEAFHIGSSPASASFFTSVFQDALAAKR